MSELDDLTKDDEPLEEVEGEEEAVPPAAVVEPEITTAPIAALLDERGKRQDAEAKLAAAEARLAEQTPHPNVIDDPEGALEHMAQQFAQRLWQVESKNSQAVARLKHDDYDVKAQAFVQMAQSNPTLVEAMHASDDPAEFAYKTATDAENLAAVQDMGAFREKIRQEEIEKLKVKGSATDIAAALEVGNLADARSSSNTHDAEISLEDAFQGR